jgi:hypothetical protein
MGMVIETKPEIKVAEALGSVRTILLKDFNARTEKGQKLSVLRFRNKKDVSFIQNRKKILLKIFNKDFSGLKYDHDFLWDNVDEKKNEKLYCSEMVAKLLMQFMNIELPVKRMKFDKNRKFWIQYFHGNPPDGMWGNAPADFEKSKLFYEVGKL